MNGWLYFSNSRSSWLYADLGSNFTDFWHLNKFCKARFGCWCKSASWTGPFFPSGYVLSFASYHFPVTTYRHTLAFSFRLLPQILGATCGFQSSLLSSETYPNDTPFRIFLGPVLGSAYILLSPCPGFSPNLSVFGSVFQEHRLNTNMLSETGYRCLSAF